MEKEAKKLFDREEDVWGFVIKASETYKMEFRKAAKIGQPPKIDEIIKRVENMDEEAFEAEKKEIEYFKHQIEEQEREEIAEHMPDA